MLKLLNKCATTRAVTGCYRRKKASRGDSSFASTAFPQEGANSALREYCKTTKGSPISFTSMNPTGDAGRIASEGFVYSVGKSVRFGRFSAFIRCATYLHCEPNGAISETARGSLLHLRFADNQRENVKQKWRRIGSTVEEGTKQKNEIHEPFA